MTEALVLPTAQQLDVPPECQLQFEKILSDLRQGFRITIDWLTWRKDFYVEAVTKLEDDLFYVYASFRGKTDGTHYVCECKVRRRKLPPPLKGSRSLEVFTIGESVTPYLTKLDNFRIHRIQDKQGGHLTEREFWRRYNASVFDRKLTEDYFEVEKAWYDKTYKGSVNTTIHYEASFSDLLFLISPPQQLISDLVE